MKDEPSFGIIIVCLIATSNDALQLARFYWKMVVDESAQLGVVLIGVNNPHLQEVEVEEYKLCTVGKRRTITSDFFFAVKMEK